MTKEELLKEIKSQEFPKQWRWGQSVFNYVDAVYQIARDVQFKDHVDCFYNDEAVDEFLDKCIARINDEN